MKKRRSTTTKTKRASAPKRGRRRTPPGAAVSKKIALLTRERDDLLDQQKAAAEVLRVIGASAGELEPVFQAMLENATRICEAKFGSLFRFDGEAFHAVATLHRTPQAHAVVRRQPIVIRDVHPDTPIVRMVRTKEIVQVADMRQAQCYLEHDPQITALVDTLGGRTLLAVPMLKKDELVGAIVTYRQEVRPFTEKQIALVESFAAQAVIAIENTRLLNELRESLQQQTATADVLRVISTSPGELGSVFQAILESATRICEANFGALFLCEGDALRRVALHNAPTAYAEEHRRRPLIRPTPTSGHGRVIATRRAVHIADLRADQAYRDGAPTTVLLADAAGARSYIGVPILKGDVLIGTIIIYRQEVRPFSDKQIALVQNFAAQAVIAIENARLLNELRQRTDDLFEALEQQTATSEVLQVISSSPGQLEPVFNAMLANATHLCGANYGVMFLCEGDDFRTAAIHGSLSEVFLRQWEPGTLFRPDPELPAFRAVKTKQVMQVADLRTTPAYLRGDPLPVSAANVAGIRSMLTVPMLKDDIPIGVIAIYRKEVRSFTEKQIDLVTSFAAQAVIAIENTRLLNELRESLQQQTATSEVLQAISISPGELQPVFDTMLAKATELCEASYGALWLREGDAIRNVAFHGSLPEGFTDQWRSGSTIRLDQNFPAARAIRLGTPVQVADMREDPAYRAGHSLAVGSVDIAGIRTLVAMPMLKDGAFVGAIAVYRREVRPFTDKQIELVQNFAAQAVIAIENTRLLNELRQSLEQQTATAEVLRVISSSPGELEPVFQAMLENATRICEAKFGTMYFREGDRFRAVAMHGAPPAYVESRLHKLIHPGPHSGIGRVLETRQVVQVEDAAADRGYSERDPMRVAAVELGGIRTLMVVPMLKENEVIGAIAIYREVVQPFIDKQIALVQNFAAQAVIAIENTRLLSELRESLQQQTATADVLKVISRSTFDLQTVLDTLVESSSRLCDAYDSIILLRNGDGDTLNLAAHYGPIPVDFRNWAITRGWVSGRAFLDREPVHIPDLAAAEEFPDGRDMALRLGFRTTLSVPLLREDVSIGVITIRRSEVKPFTEKQIDLVRTFADQAVIAIENVRLFEAEQQRTHELAKSLENLRIAQDRLVQTEKLASLGQLTAGIAHEIKNPLNFVNNFSAVSVELIDELREELGSAHLDSKLRTTINEIADTLQGNLDKVVQHGKRADAIVKNMLLHSRQGSGEHRPVDINALVEESLNLAYHGARAEKQGFNITLERSFDPAAGEADLFPQEITRVLLNLISNGFYAATKRKAETNGGDYEPTLAAATKNLGDRVEIRIRDNGTGIPAEVREKLFNPFFTTKPAGEGTGLGLSISHDIVVKQHGGSIEIDTRPGEFTEFRIVLPRGGTSFVKSAERA